jgi:hypothetical protein
MESHRKGDLSEAAVITEFVRREISVSRPFGDDERYDVVVETPEGDLLRVRIETGRLVDGTVEFHGTSQHTNSTGNTYEGYDGDVDYFAVYVHGTGTTYLVAENEFDRSRESVSRHPTSTTRRSTGRRSANSTNGGPRSRASGLPPDDTR